MKIRCSIGTSFFRNTCIGSFKGYDAFMTEKSAGSNTDTDVETTDAVDVTPTDTTPTSFAVEDTGKNSAFTQVFFWGFGIVD